MSKITIDLDEITAKRKKLLEELKGLDALINYIELIGKDTINDNYPSTKNVQKTTAPVTKFDQAIELCEKYLNDGNTVNTLKQFMEYMESKGLKLSRPGLSLALSRSKIKYDKDKQTWKLVN